MNRSSNNGKDKIFIHIGAAKAASTTLQKQLFDRHSGINNLGAYPTGNLGQDSSYINNNNLFLQSADLRKFYFNLVILDEIEYRSSDNFDLYKQSIYPLLKNEKLNLFSNERFTSSLFSYDDIKSKATRLKNIFPDAKIMMIVRNQYNIIVSQYRDWPFDPRCVRIGKPVTLNKWIEIALKDDFVKYFSSLKYYEIADIYSELYGKDNVGLFVFEELIRDLKKFATKLSNFLQINPEETKYLLLNKHENISVSHRFNIYRMLRRKRILPNLDSPKLNFLPNGLKKNTLAFLKGGNKKDYVLSTHLKTQIEDYFALSNEKLQDSYKLDLNKFDYPLS